VPQVEVGFCAVVGDIAFPVFIRIKSSRIDVDIRVKLLNRNGKTSGLEQFAERGGDDSFAKDEVTPPVTKIYLAEEDMGSRISAAKVGDLANSGPKSRELFRF